MSIFNATIFSIRKRIRENLSTQRNPRKKSDISVSLAQRNDRLKQRIIPILFLFFPPTPRHSAVLTGCMRRSQPYFHCKLNAVPIKLQRQLVLSMLASTSSKRINHAIWVDQSRLTLPKWRLRNPETSIS